jgi:hypothetical protein
VTSEVHPEAVATVTDMMIVAEAILHVEMTIVAIIVAVRAVVTTVAALAMTTTDVAIVADVTVKRAMAAATLIDTRVADVRKDMAAEASVVETDVTTTIAPKTAVAIPRLVARNLLVIMLAVETTLAATIAMPAGKQTDENEARSQLFLGPRSVELQHSRH